MILKEKQWHKLFEIGLIIKAANGIWEILTGLSLLFVSKTMLSNAFISFTRNEISEEPQDRLVHFLGQLLEHLSVNTKNFIAIYILVHGLINIFLAYNLLKKRLWAYLVSIALLSTFIFYQLFRVSRTHSLFLLGLTLFDAVFVMLIWHEYRRHQKSQ